jgi:hypothetical protein
MVHTERHSIIAYLEFILVLSTDNLTANLLQLTPNIDSRLDLLSVLRRWVFQECSIALPLEVRNNTIDQGQSSSLVEWYGCDALVRQLGGNSGSCNG